MCTYLSSNCLKTTIICCLTSSKLLREQNSMSELICVTVILTFYVHLSMKHPNVHNLWRSMHQKPRQAKHRSNKWVEYISGNRQSCQWSRFSIKTLTRTHWNQGCHFRFLQKTHIHSNTLDLGFKTQANVHSNTGSGFKNLAHGSPDWNLGG